MNNHEAKQRIGRRRLLLLLAVMFLPLLGTLGWASYLAACGFAESERLHLAARTGDTDALNRVLDAHPDWLERKSRLGLPPLQTAAWYGQVDAVKVLIHRGADVNAYSFASGSRYKSMNALHYAAVSGHVGAAKVLIDAGVDINSKTAAGHTPLDLTDVNREHEMARFLTERGGVRNVRLAD